MEITRDRKKGTFRITQAAYLQIMLERFGLVECKSARVEENSNLLSEGYTAEKEYAEDLVALSPSPKFLVDFLLPTIIVG